METTFKIAECQRNAIEGETSRIQRRNSILSTVEKRQIETYHV